MRDLDKYEYRVKTEQMLEYLESKQYKKAMEIADTIDWRRVKSCLLYTSAYKEKMDKNRFIQNLILDNMLVVDVYNQAKKMKIPVEQRRVVFLIESKNEGETLILETMRGLYATGMKDFVTAVDERHVRCV